MSDITNGIWLCRSNSVNIDPGETRYINMQIAPDIDPAWLLVSSGRPENIDTVLADGRILKRKGKLTTINVPEVMKTASAALQGLRVRTKLPPFGIAKS